MSGPGTPLTFEGYLAQQANEAIQQGADPAKVSAQLQRMVQHLRANPDLAAQAQEAVNAGKDPHDVASQLATMAPAAAPTPQAKPSIIDPASRTGAVLSGLAQGATLGFADEALGGIDALNHIAPKWLGGEGAPASEFSQRYAETRDRVRAGDEAGKEAHGTAHAVSSFAGSVLPFVTGGVAGKLVKPTLARAMGEGAALGGVAGFGNAKGDAVQQAEGTAAGAALGGLGTLALRGVAAGGSKVVDAIGRSRVAQALPSSAVLNARDQAKRVLLQKLAAGGKSLDEVAADASQPVHAGQPTTIADLGGDAVTRVARGVQTKPNTSAIVRDAFERRQRGQLGRIQQAGTESLGIAPGNMQQAAADKLAEAQAASNPLYHQFYAQPAVDDPAISELLQRPYFNKAYQQAQTQGKLLPSVTGRTPARVTQTVTTERPITELFPDLSESRSFREAPDLPPRMVKTTEEVTKDIPTPFLLHRTKLNFGDFIDEGPSAMPGAGGAGSSFKRDLTQAMNEFRGAVESRYPIYRDANAAYAGPAGERTSLLEGGKAFQGEVRPNDIAYAASQADSRPSFQRGAWNELLQKAGSVSDRNGEAPKDVAHVFNGNPNVRAALEAVFGDIQPSAPGTLGPAAPTGFPALTNALSRESRYSRTASDILGGSPTMNKAEDLAGLTQGALPAHSVLSAASGHPTSILRLLLSRADKGRSEYADQVAEALAPMVTAGIDDPRQLQGLLTQLQQFAPTLQRRSTAADAIRRALQEQIGAGTARITAGGQ